jgi:hypothetical protein
VKFRRTPTSGNHVFGNDATLIAREQLREKVKRGSLVLEDFAEDALAAIGFHEEIVLFFNGQETRISWVGGIRALSNFRPRLVNQLEDPERGSADSGIDRVDVWTEGPTRVTDR